ncbi:MAG: hypothetical protein ACFE8L_06355 [Candidatus Hodarchaeota archaeon]
MIIVYELNNQSEEFEELKIKENVPLFELLDSDRIFLFVDAHNEKVWEWQGKNTSTRMKFITTQLVPSIRDKHDISYTITTVDEGDETVAFKIMIGLP